MLVECPIFRWFRHRHGIASMLSDTEFVRNYLAENESHVVLTLNEMERDAFIALHSPKQRHS